MNSTFGNRIVFENAKKALTDAGLSAQQVNAAKLSQGYLRFEQLFAPNVNSFIFPILNNQTNNGAAQRPTEKRLNLQDAFYMSELGIYVTKATGATVSNFVLNTYFSPFTYTNAALMETFYNGALSIAVNNDIVQPGLDLLRFRTVPQTQATAAPAAASPIDEFHGLENTAATEPNIVFIGSKNTVVQINLPAAVATVDANTYIVIVVKGVLAQNVTVVS